MKIITLHIIQIFCLLTLYFDLFSQGCNDTSYNFRLITNVAPFAFQSQISSSNQDNVVAGNMSMASGTDGFIMRNTETGTVQWVKNLHNPDNASISLDKVKELANGDLFVIGKYLSTLSNQGQMPFVARFDPLGNLLWYKAFKLTHLTTVDIQIRTQQIEEDNVGNTYFAFNLYGLGDDYSVITKLDAVGGTIWSRGFVPNPLILTDPVILNGLFFKNNDLIVTGLTPPKGGSNPSGYLGMKLDASTGDLISTKWEVLLSGPDYGSPDFTELEKTKSFPLENGHFMLLSPCSNGHFSPPRYQAIEFDENLEILSKKTIIVAPPTGITALLRDMVVKPSGEIVYCLSWGSTVYFGSIMPDWQPVVHKKLILNGTGYYNSGSRLAVDNNGQIRFTPVYAAAGTYGVDCYYLDINNQFETQCFNDKDSVFTEVLNFETQFSDFNWDHVDNNALTEQAFGIIVSDVPFASEEICRQISICNELKISGPSNVCLTTSPVEFIASKSPDCLRKINWEIQSSAIDSMKIIDDTTVHVYFAGQWSGYLFASLSDCTLKDSIFIAVASTYNSPMLGSDTTFCSGDSLRLNAGTGYQSYLWNNSATTQDIIVKEPGNYFVLAERPDGCFDSDTITVFPPNDLPQFALAGPILCRGQNDTLTPGLQFVNYLWQDASNSSTFHVNVPGTYWVEVTDENGCKGRDTSTITELRAPPSNFIQSDTAICNFESIILSPNQSFNSYYWSNGSIQPAIEIFEPGTYFLQVMDDYGCTGTEEILIREKVCANYIEFPSAFTPNNDGKNDTFKPFVRGNLTVYHLQIYNRWGERLFESFNPFHTWNGTFKNSIQPNGVFIWHVKYQFSGEPARSKKGVLTLIR